MPESACAWRLSTVLRELRYPAQKWMIQTAADLYGADVQTRTELQDLPEVTYHDLGEVVTAVENRDRHGGCGQAHPESGCCEWRA
jgi:hypothetical protein